jgi:ankyrin repeat protein
LLQKGVDMNKATMDGWSALQLAIHKNNIEGNHEYLGNIIVLKTFLSYKEVEVN